MFKRLWFYITVLWEMLVDWVDSKQEYPARNFNTIIFTDGWIEGSGWKEVQRHVIDNNIYVVYEKIAHHIKEVRWFKIDEEGKAHPVLRPEIERLISVKTKKE